MREWLRGPTTVQFYRCKVSHKKNSVPHFIRLRLGVIYIFKIAFWATLWGLKGNVRTPPVARRKARGRLPISLNWTFLLSLTIETLKRKSVEVGVFRRGWVTLNANFRQKGASHTNPCWCQKPRVIALSRGVKISAVHCLVLSQNMHVRDRQTDRQIDKITTANTALAYLLAR